MKRPNFCTPVFPNEYDYVTQFEDAVGEANRYHKKIHEECPPPYYPFDMGKLYGLVQTVRDNAAELATLEAVLDAAREVGRGGFGSKLGDAIAAVDALRGAK